MSYRAPAGAHVGKVRLAVSSLKKSAEFYTDVIGLRPIASSRNLMQLGAEGSDEVLLELEEMPGLRPLGRQKRLGLYHFALLLPSRRDLANFVQHAQQIGAPFGASDHLASEATYFEDPDGITVEVYADRPQSEWKFKNGEVVLTLDPLDYEGLLAEADGRWSGAPAGTTIGHMHFFIGDLEKAKQFYCEGLGLDVMSHIPGALFVSAGGYHHHVGLNTWAAGSPLAGPEDPRILYWEWVLSNEDEVAQVTLSLSRGETSQAIQNEFVDPWGIELRLRT